MLLLPEVLSSDNAFHAPNSLLRLTHGSSVTISGSSLPPASRTRAIVAGRRNRLGPALPG